MPINITAVGGAGTHSLAKTTVNTDEDYIYYKNTGADVIPTALSYGKTFLYTAGVGALGGLTNSDLLYVITTQPKKLMFSRTAGGAAVDLTSATGGSIKFNTPVLYANKLNIDSSTAENQAVKYYTGGTPLTGLVSGNTYFLKNVSISDFSGQQSLYTITGNTHTFTSAGVTGRLAPTISQLRTAYTGATAWSGTYLNQGAFQGYQDWTVPVSGIYEFQAAGASGYDGDGAGTPGLGAIVKGRVTLTKGEVITIAVGQKGNAPATGATWGGSGGGTFVVRKTGNQPLFIAGGGSAESGAGAGRSGSLSRLAGTSTNGTIAGGNAGFGGRATGGYSAAGGGFSSRGQDLVYAGTTNAAGGGSFLDGLVTSTNARTGGYGGFGGGAQADGNVAGQSGGGGGYSGGGGARSTTANQSGGGGGSFITSTATNVATSTGQFDSVSTFNGTVITNLAAYNTGDGNVVMTLVSSFTTGNEVYPTAVDAANGTNKIAIAQAGSSYHAFVPINYDDQNDLIHSATPHTLNDGEAIILTFNSTPPTGLSNATVYYVNVVNAYTYRLSSTAGPSFTTVNLTTPSARETVTSSVLNRVVVNIATDTLTITNHGFLVDQPLQYDAGSGTPISPLQDGVTYYVQEVLNANQIRLKVALNSPTYINITSAGTGTAHSFIFVTVNALEDTLYIANHGLVSGQAVKYSNGGGTTIPGLTNNQTYYIVKVDNSLVKLATTTALTTYANITGPGTGTQSLIVTPINYVTDTITIPKHGFLQKELVQYDSKGQTVINGLTTATPYYVIFIDGDNIKLATTPENATAGTAVDLTDTPIGVGRHTLQSLSKTPDGIYTITSIPSSSTFQVTAQGSVPKITKTFNPRTAIDLVNSYFYLPSHGLLTGTKLTYSKGSAATAITGLTDLSNYYAVAVNRDYLRLSTSADNAAAGITLTVSDFGTGVGHSFETDQINGNVTGGGSVTVGAGSVLVNGSGTSFSKILKVGDRFRLFPPNTLNVVTFASGDINTTTDKITKSNHGLTTGQTVKFASNGGVAPSPLVDGYYYFVRAVTSSEITLHSSISDATNNLNIVDFSNVGTGSSFTLTRTTPVGPIIRRITAIGSDTQITVDRPYSNAYTAVSYSYPTFLYVRPQGYSLHRPFDGGVEMSVGSGTSLGQIIRQTRKYFRYQSGKGIQTSCGINFKPSVDLESLTQFSSTTIEAKTRRPHGLISGLFIRISESTDSYGNVSSVYNGEFQITVVDLTTFRFAAQQPIVEPKAYGFPQFFVREWANGAVRSGMFDFQNGMFYEFDGQHIYAVRRSSTQQIAGTVSALQGSELIFGTGTKFSAQVAVGDYVVMRGQSYRIVQIDSDTRMSVRPEYKGSSGTEKEFNPQTAVSITTDTISLIGHGFSHLLPVVYNSIDGDPIGGLINGRTYYVNLIDNNSFKLYSSPDSLTVVDLSGTGTTTVHSLTPAKSGIVVTKTVDTRTKQEDWSIDPVDGSGPTGYNLDLSRIQMAYIDYSWYGAGKIRYGFKTTDGQVQYVHEYVHNNHMFESYFRSGNLPARYEVVTYNNPTYIPFLFHWGTSVIMDGRFDDDNAYLFTSSSQALPVVGTTAKSYSAASVSAATNLITVTSHGFSSGDLVQFEGIATNGLRGYNSQNAGLNLNTFTVTNKQLTTNVATLTTGANHNFTTGQTVTITGVDTTFNGTFTITGTGANTFTYALTAADVASTAVSPVGAATNVAMYNNQVNLTNASTYSIYRASADSIGLFPPVTGSGAVTGVTVATVAQTTNVVTVVTATPHNLVNNDIVKIIGMTQLQGTTSLFGAVTVTNTTTFTILSAVTLASPITTVADTGAKIWRLLDITSTGNTQYTYFIYPNGALNNTSGPNYQPLLSIRLSPSVSSGLTGKLGDRDVINRMQLRLKEVGISSTQLVDVKLLLNPRLNNLNFQSMDAPSLTQTVKHTSSDTVSGGVQIYNFRAAGGSGGTESTTTVDISALFELSNSILGGDSIFPDGPDIMTIAVSRLTGTSTTASAKISWSEAQA